MEYWSLRPDLDLRWEDWDGQWCLYQGVSGETHFLNAIGAAILMSLRSREGSLSTLCETVAMECGILVNGCLETQVAASLDRFAELGLIRRHPRDIPAT